MILFIKHIDIEGPETLSTFFAEKKMEARTVELQEGERLPDDLSPLEAVISLGGPMNVYEEDKYPFFKDENVFLKRVIDQEIPFIGICLGSQLLAKACEAKIKSSPEKEIGFFPVELTEAGKNDPLFQEIEGDVDVFQWHEDMWEVPPNGKLLASSPGCPHQVFKVGPAAYGLQFHVEVTEPTIEAWADAYFEKGSGPLIRQKQLMIDEYGQKQKYFHQTANTIYNNFFKIIHQHQ